MFLTGLNHLLEKITYYRENNETLERRHSVNLQSIVDIPPIGLPYRPSFVTPVVL